MVKRMVDNKWIMLTAVITLSIFLLFFSGMNMVKADKAIEYEKSFISIEIENGDTLTSIAKEYAKSEADYQDYIEEVKCINSIKDDTIHHGCYLLVPIYTIVE